MHAKRTRRKVIATLSFAGAAALLRGGSARADEPSPETTTIRLAKSTAVCLAPLSLAEQLLGAEGFTDVQFVQSRGGSSQAQRAGRGEIDLGMGTAPSLVFNIDTGEPITALAGIHTGCYELFAHAPIRTVSDLMGKKVAVARLTTDGHLYVAIMAANVGLDPRSEIEWVESGNAVELFAERRVDAFLAFPPEPQELRVRGINRVILKTGADKPWSQYLCCIAFGNRSFVREHPVATKRAVRAILKSAELCAADPKGAARQLVEGGLTKRYDHASEALTEVPYALWREFDPEDTMRFCALRLQEAGIIRSSPKTILAEGTDWRFLHDLKRELKV